ncbi:MAG: 3-dehydroquinate synthase [Dethiobacter sp.]|jgi:3-dehydroquinate synthase|nr:3-dehydroquinate synthase [Dethiobacter sp.]MBS3900790.1 3-dehydroquinate synthase [Dethiobacter sp.]MBS3988762.1 3-dehydroquinate synthase [Dethiobacter sp.]
MRLVEVALGERSYPIYIGQNMWHEIPQYWAERVKPGKLLLVSDETVFPLYGGQMIDGLQQAGFAVHLAVVPAGEGSKTLARAEQLYGAAIEAGLERRDLIVALGGGVVGDLAGFVAATYLRGVTFAQVPTTLLAQVDSSVGGKTAVNHSLGKNLIGAFYQPKLVWVELDTLLTLPRREYLAGAAEVIKYGVILSEALLKLLAARWQDFLAKEPELLTAVVGDCCALKAAVVTADEREEGLRAILNFGHTLGHALEAATSYSYYLHGEAVLAGMAMAVKLALGKGILQREEAAMLLELFDRVGLVPPPEALLAADVLAALKHDKKREAGRTVFILPEAIGKVRAFDDLEPEAVRQVLGSYLSGVSAGGLLRLTD